MGNLRETDWYEKWKSFFVEAIEVDAQNIEDYAKTLTESKTKETISNRNKLSEEELENLLDKEFSKFEKSIKKQITDFKKKIKKHHEG